MTTTTPEDVERDKNKRKVFWEVSAGPGHPERLQGSQCCTKSSRLQQPAKTLGSLLLKLGTRILRENASKWMKLLKVMN